MLSGISIFTQCFSDVHIFFGSIFGSLLRSSSSVFFSGSIFATSALRPEQINLRDCPAPVSRQVFRGSQSAKSLNSSKSFPNHSKPFEPNNTNRFYPSSVSRSSIVHLILINNFVYSLIHLANSFFSSLSLFLLLMSYECSPTSDRWPRCVPGRCSSRQSRRRFGRCVIRSI